MSVPMIPALTPVTAKVAPWNERLWTLIARERAGTISAPEQRELNIKFREMEAGVSTTLQIKRES